MISQLSAVARSPGSSAARARPCPLSVVGFQRVRRILPRCNSVALLPVFHWRSLWVLAAVPGVITMAVMLHCCKQETDAAIHGAKARNRGDGRPTLTRLQMFRHWVVLADDPLGHRPPPWARRLFFQQVHLTEVIGLDAWSACRADAALYRDNVIRPLWSAGPFDRSA